MARKKTGYIQRRGLRSWRIRYFSSDGQRQAETIHGERDDAERELAIRLGEIAKGLPVSSKPNTVLFGELADDVLTDYEVNAFKSLDDIEARFRLHIIPVFGRRKASSITTAQIRSYTLNRQKEGAKPGTINRELEAIRHTFKFATKGRKLMTEPHIPMLKEDNIRTGFFTRDEVERVASHLSKEVAPIVWFGFLTGWRLGEILGLEWRSVDFTRGEIRLDPGSTKNGKGRVFPMSGELRTLLDALKHHTRATLNRTATPAAAVTPNPMPTLANVQRVFTAGSFRKSWKTACYKAGLPCTVEPVKKGGKRGAVKVIHCARTFHDLRRSAIREWIKNGMPEKVAMMLSGHLTRSILDRYNVIGEADLLQAVQYLERKEGLTRQLGQ